MENIKKELLKIKENLFENTNKENYNKIYNLISDCDELLEILYDYNFIDYLEAENILINETKEGGIDRARCFIGDTYSDDIYKLNGYGNLANICDQDFESLINDIIDYLK